MAATRFPVRFTRLNRALALLGMSRRNSWVDVDGETLRVRMAWAFAFEVPRASVRDARLDSQRVWGWGVHGWRGRWLVNGSSSGLVRVHIDPPGRGRTIGFPIRVSELRVSVDDPDGLVAALTTRP